MIRLSRAPFKSDFSLSRTVFFGPFSYKTPLKSDFFELREVFDKLCAHGQEFVPDGLQCEDIVHVDRDVQVTESLLTEEEIVEEIHGIFDEENENDDVEIAERSEDIPIKPNSQEVFRAIETLLDYSMFTNSGEIGKLATKVSLMIEKENLKLKRQKKITDFF